MEIEYYCKPPQYRQPQEKSDTELHQEWVAERFNWYVALGLDPAKLRQREQSREELAHYAKATTDIEYLFPGSLGWSELEGVANRQDYDLSAHSKDVPLSDLERLQLSPNPDSTQKLDYFDEQYVDPETGKKGIHYIPYVIEPSAGADRATLAFLCDAYDEEIVTTPAAADLIPLQDAIAAAQKSISKKLAELTKKPTDGTPSVEQLTLINTQLTAALANLPMTILTLEAICGLPGADKVELLKKVRPLAAKLCDEYTRVVLRLCPQLAPIKVAVFPLKKNEPRIVTMAKDIKRQLQPFLRTVYDDTAAIGKLYRRQDEIGTPICITVDFQSLEDATVTIRNRDTMQQERAAIATLPQLLTQKLQFWGKL
jgi:glycyl-tRNA synthetase